MGLLMNFRKGLNRFLSRLKVTSNESTVSRFVSTTIDNPDFLNNLIVVFFFLSTLCLDMFSKV